MTWLDRICTLVDERSDGAKVDVPAIVRAMTPTQVHIVRAITVLIERGELDAATLRRPVAKPAPKPEKLGQGRNPGDIDGKLILAEIDAFIAREGIPRATFSRQCMGDPKFVGRLVRRNKSVRRASAEKIRRFIAERDAERIQRSRVIETPARPHSGPTEPPEPEAADDGDGAARLPLAPSPMVRGEPLSDVTPGELLGEITAFREKHGIAPTRFGKLAVNDFALIGRLIAAKTITQRTADRIRAFIADYQPNTPGASGTAREAPSVSSSGDTSRIEDRAPSHEPVSAVAPTAPARSSVDVKVNIGPRRDPTQPPETPGLDAGDKAREAAARYGAAIRRGQEQNATALVDAGVDPATQSSYVAQLMRSIIARRSEEARLLDPVEQAKAVLRRKYRPVVGAEFADPPGRKGTYLVGRKIVSQAELLAMAGIA